MIRNRKQARMAFRAAIALGMMAGATALSAPALAQKAPAAPKISLSKAFQPLAVAASKAIETAKTRADVVAARTALTTAQTALTQSRGAARAPAQASFDAALAALGNTVAPEKAMVDGAFAGATTPDDRYMSGNLAISLGDLAKDTRLQRRGLEAMLGSGKVAPADAPRLQYYLGQFAFDQKEYAAARTALQAAVSGGFVDNDVHGLLAEAYLSDNQVPQGLAVLKQAIASRNATPNKAPAGWYRRGLGAAYGAKLLDQAADFAMTLVQAYPAANNWSGAITVVREIGKFPAQETLDLMRLMGRTNSYAEERDYVEYIQAADARRLPGEVLKVIEQGVSAGKLRANDPFVSESRVIANGRIAADRASLVGLERDARAPAASAATVSGAADAFLSYGDVAKAEALYNVAMAKPGAETDRLLTRLGIAQLDQGNTAAAQANFAKVGGARKYIAQLWGIYAAQKAAPAAVAAP
jgi:tetratricopeptide (TPR) repeat protein